MGIAALFLALVTTIGGVTIDWSRGVATVVAGAAPNLEAPNPQIARVAAERLARKRASTRLGEAVAKLPVLGGGTVAELSAKDGAAAARLGKALAEPTVTRTRYASDGGIELEAVVSMDAIAMALDVRGARSESSRSIDEAGDDRKAWIVTELGEKEPSIVPGVAVHYFATLTDARKDPRLGKHPEVSKKNLQQLRSDIVAVVLGNK